ncbi:methyltransferase domain-containing protein [Sphingomonas sp. R647]|uniref:SAM-dependent methyltransferase n=1 Tax=Sphingomonas sp. R647 TaxID=2875233 RepID=UPI001CD2F6B2|nr:methyltransferase domain-containing protein [Sphingomonas sp. R647]MCA1197117.1 methyltransferase domain-containing protein [Sphingomonas sp. R647]
MRVRLSSAARFRIAALVLAVVALGLIALGARCMLPTMVSCSASTIFGGPALDVPYKSTRREVVALMLEMGEVKPGDKVIDLGTGDGRILIAAAKERGAKGLGVDLDPVLIRKARAAARKAGVADKVRFEAADLFETDLSSADVVTMYLLPEVNLRLRPQLFAQLKPGTRVVSHAFDMGDWKPEAKRRAGGATVYMWRIPARPGTPTQTPR